MIYLRGLVVWLILILAESIHGTLRAILIAPYLGDFRARQISVFTGAAIMLLIALGFIRWLRPEKTYQLFAVGILWLTLTLGFEVLLGRYLLNYSWDRIASDYRLFAGGLLPIGLLILALSPWIAARLRRVR